MTVTPVIQKEAPSIEIPVTAGNLKNGHVYLREFLWFFPKESIRGQAGDSAESLPCTLELAGLGTVETEIDADKAIFRWRGWKKFFLRHGVQEADAIMFTKLQRSRFSVTVQHKVLAGIATPEAPADAGPPKPSRPRTHRRCNDLSGDEWLRNSVSIWSDIRKSSEELALGHPAIFPATLCERLMLTFLRRRGKHRILDPFMGSGSTLVAASSLGKVGMGLEINPDFIEMAKRRLAATTLFHRNTPQYEIHQTDARHLLDVVKADSIDLCLTSPPYWDILNQKRTADGKNTRNYGNLEDDLGTLTDYGQFLEALTSIFAGVLKALKAGAYCLVIVMDLRKKDRFYPFHSDLAARMIRAGFILDDMIVWDRSREYNNLRPLGYPSVFRVNKIHEFILIFRKPPVRV